MRGRLTPPRIVADQGHPLVGVVPGEPERSAGEADAVGEEGRGVVPGVDMVAVGLGLDDRMEGREDDLVGLGDPRVREFEGEVVDDLDLDAFVQQGRLRSGRRVEDIVEGGGDVGGRDRRAVVPDRVVAQGPPGGQR